MKKISVTITLLLAAVILPNNKITNTIFAQQNSPPAEHLDGANTIAIESETRRAKEAIKEFSGSLQAELKKALQKGGAVHAISVCNAKADLIARDISLKRNISLKRVSLKNRNPDNIPNPWQKTVLENFETRKLNGEIVSNLTYHEIVKTKRVRQFRFMKAIPTGPICIQCHGTQISSEVTNQLDQLYPDDNARGFRPGDIRGAFVVTRELSL